MNAALWRNMTPSERECWHWAEGDIGIADPAARRGCIGDALAASADAAEDIDYLRELTNDLTDAIRNSASRLTASASAAGDIGDLTDTIDDLTAALDDSARRLAELRERLQNPDLLD